MRPMRWGLIPRWAKDPAIGNRLINARAETVAEKNSFRDSLRKRRCLVPSDGFYEWQKLPGRAGKQPMRIVMKGGEPFAFAGLWDAWKHPETKEIVETFTIITTTANELMAAIHDRMPVILAKEDENEWLDCETEYKDALLRLLKPFEAEKMTAYEVGTEVNSPTRDARDLIRALK